MSAAPIPDELTRDRLLGGRVVLRQPKHGFRAAIDAVLLAACVPAVPQATELGCGSGAAALCLAARLPAIRVTGVELDPALASLARQNVAANGFADRVRVEAGDIADWRGPAADCVLLNPPYLPAARAAPPAPARRMATVEGAAGLGAWIAAALRAVKPRGTVAVVQRADRLDALLAALAGTGAIAVFPLWPHAGEAATRVIVTARKGARTPLRLAAGLVLHEPDGRYTAAADAVLRGAPLAV